MNSGQKKASPPSKKTVLTRLRPTMTREQKLKNLLASLKASGIKVHL